MMDNFFARSIANNEIGSESKHRGLIRTNISGFLILYRSFDILLILACMQLSLVAHKIESNPELVGIGFLSLVIFLYIAESLDLYRSWRTIEPQEMYFTLWLCCILTSGLLAVTLSIFNMHSNAISDVAVSWLLLTITSLSLWRFFFRQSFYWFRRHGYNTRTAAIIGVTESGIDLVMNLENNPQLGIKALGFYDDRELNRIPKKYQSSVRGATDEAIQLAMKNEVDIIYIAMPMRAHKRTEEILKLCGNSTVSVHIIPDIFVFNMLHACFHSVGSIETLSVYDTPLYGVNNWLKRAEDILLASAILCVVSIPMLLTAIAVKLSSNGPVLFKQSRYGLCGRKIEVWKFRTMTTLDNGDDISQVTKNDSRITKVGRFLRRTSLDELPQFFNVLQGTMSVVGPRPHAISHNEQYRSLINCYMLRHVVKPGITGWAQVNGFRGETSTLNKMEKRIEYDLDYIRNWSLPLDLKIVLLTIFTGFSGENAY